MEKGSKVAKSHRCFIQSHLSETEREIEAVLSLYQDIEGFEDVKTYTEIYHACGLLGPKTIMGHGIYLGARELKLLSQSQTILAHCPTSNAPVEDLGLGSGLFPFKNVEKAKIRWALGSDIGGGPFLSMFDVIQSFVKQNKKKKVSGATYLKGLYRATLAGAEALGQETTAGNLSSKKWANFLLVESPKFKKGESVDKVLEQVIDPFSKSREEYRNLVQETYFRGEQVYSK
jgi:guanine deaminase